VECVTPGALRFGTRNSGCVGHACAGAGAVLPSGRMNVEHVENVLSRMHSVPMPPKIDTALQLATPPRADTSRYDGLRQAREARHACSDR
jgi:hypothetical protein